MQKKKFFCEVIKDLLCVLCSKSKEHMAHRHCSIDWVAEEYRVSDGRERSRALSVREITKKKEKIIIYVTYQADLN